MHTSTDLLIASLITSSTDLYTTINSYSLITSSTDLYTTINSYSLITSSTDLYIYTTINS